MHLRLRTSDWTYLLLLLVSVAGVSSVAYRIVGFLGKALLEKVRLRTPGFQSRLHRWRSNGEIEEPERGLIGLKFPRHQSRAFFRNRIGRHPQSHEPGNGLGFAPGTALGSKRAGERRAAARLMARLED